MLSTQLEELMIPIHKTAVEKGWWEGERDTDEIYSLFFTEISEAVEEMRKPQFEDNLGQEMWCIHPVTKEPTIGYVEVETEHGIEIGKPEGIGVEIADAVIRVLDWMGFKGYKLEGSVDGVGRGDLKGRDSRAIMNMNVSLAYAYTFHEECETENEIASLCDFIDWASAYFASRDWNMIKVIEAKMRYNDKRTYRHGGKKF